MIIPPDPEKDPRLFAESSTPSLVPPPSESSIDLATPEAAHLRNGSYGYPFGDDMAVGSVGWEALPPYERRISRNENGLPSAGLASRQPIPDPPHLFIPTQPLHHRSSVDLPSPSDGSITPTNANASTSRLHLPPPSTSSSPATTLAPNVASSSKTWESSSSTRPVKRRRRLLGIPIPRPPAIPVSPRVRKWWKRYKRWVYVGLVIFFIGIGLMIGLLVGFEQGLLSRHASPQPWQDNTDTGKKATQWASGSTSLNLTYVASRDGPDASDGNMTLCNNFSSQVNSNFSLLSVPYPASQLSVATFNFSLSNTTAPLAKPFFFTSSGIASAGTVEFIGSDAPQGVITGGSEGVLRVDVVVRYSGLQNLPDIMQVCSMARSDGSLGVGVYTPTQTDGKVTNVYMLDPTQLPQFHVIVRLPPSTLMGQANASLYLPSVTLDLERMAVRMGSMNNVRIGSFNVSSGRGGVNTAYLAAGNVSIETAENAVRGKWNVSESIYVNVTDASILADVILFDPGVADNSTTVNSSDKAAEARRSLEDGELGGRDPSLSVENVIAERAPSPSPGGNGPIGSAAGAAFNVFSDALRLASLNLTTVRTISTTFSTSQGMVAVSYLHQPPRVALTSLIGTGGGDIDVSMHPNYVGPFAVHNVWGLVDLPPPQQQDCTDPFALGRKRAVVEGVIDVPSGSLFDQHGVNSSTLATSAMTISGGAYWADPNPAPGTGFQTSTAEQVQLGLEGRGSELMVFGAWGDVRVSFDGT